MLYIALISIVFAVFFYCQAFQSGMGRKRWATAGLLLGPLVWPMFRMEKRMKTFKRFGRGYSMLNA